MLSNLDEQINQLKHNITELESQRGILGDETVEATLVPLKNKLKELEFQLEQSTVISPAQPQRQRKLVTLLYMDMVDSTAMTRDLDPEDNLELMENVLLRLVEPIQEHGGRVTRYTGDGFKAVFGDPTAREDDPEQAIRAGLEILDVSKAVAKEIEQEWEIEDFQVRIGIDTGLAALGGQTEAEDTVKGRVVNLAVRIESAAPPGGLLISHNTYRHVRGVFNVDPLEPISAKGIPEPVPVYLVMNLKPRAFHVLTRGVEGVETHMIGRVTELDFLKGALLTAIEEGEGQVVTITGEAGVGKSRLLYEFDNWIELLPPDQDVLFFQGRGRQEAQGLPYSLLRDLFAFRFQILDDDSGKEARRKIEVGFCEVFGTEEDDIMRAHILGQLLGYDFSASPHLKGVLNDAEQLRNRGLMYLVQYFEALSLVRASVLFLEDIHWADDSSLDVVMQLGEYTPELPLLIVGAARPSLFDSRPYWGEGLDYHTLLELRPLTKRESRQLVFEILKQADDIPDELREMVIQGAEGNPFYTEELIKMLIEDQVVIPGEETWGIDMARLEQIEVPSTLTGVLQARLDSLPSQERTVLQQASVVGRLFWDRIVTDIQAGEENGIDPQLIPHVLTSLRNRELVYRHEESAFVGAVEYLFKHDVLREVTYESVIKRLRKTYHGLVADWLIANCGDRIGEYSGLIAEHFLLAGKKERACQYYLKAGEQALLTYSNSEAENNYRHTLDLSPPEYLRADLLTGLGESLFRQGQPQKARNYWFQAIDLYQDLGEMNKLGDLYARLSYLFWHTDDFLKAWDLCNLGLKKFEGEQDSNGYARLLAEGGRTAIFSKNYDQVIPLCERAIDMAMGLENLVVEGEAKTTLAIYKSDKEESLEVLTEVAEMAEANGLFHTASRAHNNIGANMSDYFIDQVLVNQHFLRSVELAKKGGDIEGMLFVLANVYKSFIDMGELNAVEEKIIDILQNFTIPLTRVERILAELNHDLMSARGEWLSALNIMHEIIKGLGEKASDTDLIGNNYDLAKLILELDRFAQPGDLLEAENALREIIHRRETAWLSRFCMVKVYIRQGRLDDAHQYFEQSVQLLPQAQYWLMTTKKIRSEVQLEFAFQEERWEEAIELCKSNFEACQRGGYIWDKARWLIDLSDALIGRNEPGDLEQAHDTYQQSLDMFTEMGAPGYIKVLEERLGDPGQSLPGTGIGD